jgi:hypothetical protein
MKGMIRALTASFALCAAAGLTTQVQVGDRLEGRLADFSAAATEPFGWGVYTTSVSVDDGAGIRTFPADFAVDAPNPAALDHGRADKSALPLRVGESYEFRLTERLSDRLGLTYGTPKVDRILKPL